MAIKAAAALSVAVGAVIIGIYSWRMNDLVYLMYKDPALASRFDGKCKYTYTSNLIIVSVSICKFYIIYIVL